MLRELPPRPSRLPLCSPLALRLRRILIAPRANLPPANRFRVVGAGGAFGVAFQQGGMALLGGEGFRRALG